MGTKGEHKILTGAKLAHMVRESEAAEDVQLLHTELESLSSQGKNYSGDIVFVDIKAKVDGKEKDLRWAVKLPPLESKERMPTHREFMVERKEIEFYTKVLPAWKKLIRERKANFEITCHDVAYAEYHDDVEKGSILALQNLKSLGFDDALDRQNGLDIHHARLALAELAKFHALGHAHLASYPGGTKEGLEKNSAFVTDYLFVHQSPTGKKIMDSLNASMVSNFYNLLLSVQEPGQDFVGAFKKKHEEENVFAFRKTLYRPDREGFKTTCHGDTHLNNIMFKYEDKDGEKVPVAASWLDVSVTRYANPCGDLVYFLYSSTTPQLRRTHLDHLLGHYHDALVRCLGQLGQDPGTYPYRNLVKDFNTYAFCGFVNSMVVVPPFYLKKEDSVGQEGMNVDWTDEDAVKAAMDKILSKMRAGYKKSPMIKTMIAGNFLDMVDRGIIKLG